MANDPTRTDKIALNDVGGHFESGDEYGMRVVRTISTYEEAKAAGKRTLERWEEAQRRHHE